MNKVNIANYIVYDLANRFNFAEHHEMDSELVGMVADITPQHDSKLQMLLADNWHKKHFVSGSKNIKFNHSEQIRQKFMI